MPTRKLSAFLLLSALAASAQAQPPAAPGTISGSIQVCETARGEHRVRLEAGTLYHLTATSTDFDPVLRLLRAGGEEVLAEDDDSGGNLSPLITYRPERTGDYVVRVASFSPAAAGDYSLSVAPAAPLPPLVTQPDQARAGQWSVYRGALGAGDAAYIGRRYDDYALVLKAGQSAMIHVEGGGMDTALQLFAADARGGEPLAENDDAGGPDPFLSFTPQQAGTYVVRVIGFDAATAGPYRLRIAR